MQQEQLGNTFLEMSRVLSKGKDGSNIEEAIIYQSKAVEAFMNLEKYADTDYLA